MRAAAERYYDDLFDVVRDIRVTDHKGAKLSFPDGVVEAVDLIMEQATGGNKVMFIGNGGSAAISSHMAIDFWKNGGIKAMSFNDGAMLTCLGNDYGYSYVFEKPVGMFSEPGDVLVAISSSGKSENILRGARMAESKGCRVITLSGFEEDNPLSSLGEINFYVPSKLYGPVEVIHHSICHCIMDGLLKVKNGQVQDR
ncbi:MAG: SIS domain-containing protein [Nitrospirae bacterium]|nr:SIS domain-containing protein [Nitrospirota bacterium]